MSDYVETLKAKREEIANKHAEISAHIKDQHALLDKLNAAYMGIEALLKLEGDGQASAQSVQRPVTISPNTGSIVSSGNVPSLAVVLKETLADGKARHLDELITVAKSRGIEFGQKDPWKAVNFTLMGIRAGKTIERVGENRWRRANRTGA